MAKDRLIEVYLDGETYLRLLVRVEDVDRTISQHLRHLIKRDLGESVDEMIARRKVREGEGEGEQG